MAHRPSPVSRYRLALVLLAAAMTAGTVWTAIGWRGTNFTVQRYKATIVTGHREVPATQQRRGSAFGASGQDTARTTSAPNDGPHKQLDESTYDEQLVNTEALQRVVALMGRGDSDPPPRSGPATTASPAAVGLSSSGLAAAMAAEAADAAGEGCDRACRWDREQETRRSRVEETCSALRGQAVHPSLYYRLTADTLRLMKHLLVLPSHRLIYCYVPKVSCTNWKRILLVAKGVAPAASKLGQHATHVAAEAHLRKLSSYPLATARRLLRDYRTFLFVRHPFQRLLSAYADKFQLDYPASKFFRKANAANMARYAAPGEERRPLLADGTANISFGQFARFVADPENQYLEPHWQEMYRECQPCMVRYDYVGHYATLKEDADAVMAATGLNQSFPASTNPTGSSQRARIQQYFSQLTAGEIRALQRRYAVDFQMFGYDVPPYLLN